MKGAEDNYSVSHFPTSKLMVPRKGLPLHGVHRAETVVYLRLSNSQKFHKHTKKCNYKRFRKAKAHLRCCRAEQLTWVILGQNDLLVVMLPCDIESRLEQQSNETIDANR